MKMRTKQILSCALLCVALMGCDSKEEKHQKYMDRGTKLYELGDYARARLEYKNAARIMPADAEVRYRIGLLDEAEGDLRGAFSGYLAAEQQNAHHRLALIKLSQYFLAAEQYEECQKRINVVLSDTPDDPDGHALQAALHLRQKDFEKTESEARFALSKEPTNVTAYTVLTGLYVAQGNQEKAGATVEEAIAKNPKSVPLLLLKAMVYERSSNIIKISEAYKVIFNLKPTEVRFRDDLAKVYLQAEQKDEAEKILRDGVESMPSNWDMKKRLIAFLNENRGLDAAEKEVKAYQMAYPENGELNFWLADLYIANKATDRAVALLEQVVAKNKVDAPDKNSLNARTTLARIHLAQGDRQLAEKLATAVLENAPNNREALFVRAQMLFENGEYQEVVASLRTIVRDNPKAVEALQLLGETLLTQGYLDLAIDTFNQLTDVDITSMPAKVRLAQLYALRGDTQRALQILALVTKLKPEYPVGWESTARVSIGAKDWVKAEEAIKVLESLNGQEVTGQFLRGQIASGQQKQDEALSYYAKVVNTNPSAPIAEHALSAYVDEAYKAKKLEEAVTFLKGLNIESPFVLTLLGDCQFKLGKKEEASISYDKAIAAGSTRTEPYMSRARIHLLDKKADEALRLLDKAAELSRGDMRVSLMKADVLMSLQRNKEAVAVYEGMLERNPALDVAANNMAQLIADYLFEDSTLLEKARIAAERFIRTTNPYYLDTLGWVYYRLGQNQQAQTILERVVSYDKKLPAAVYYHYGAILEKAGQPQQAKEQLKKALDDPRPFPGIDHAKALLKSL